MCNGYWESCKCEDCKRVTVLYEELEWYSKDKDNKEIIKEIEKEIESMGYSI